MTINFSFCIMLTLIFITLKLCSVITWSWFWILSPILWPLYLIYYAFLAMFWGLIAVVFLIMIAVAFSWMHEKRA